MSRRVAVTGLGVVSPLGIGTEASWNAIAAGESGIRPLTVFDAKAFSVATAGEVPPAFFAEGTLVHDRRSLRLMGRISRLAVGAAMLAVSDAGLDLSGIPTDRKGVCLGANLDDMHFLDLCRVFASCPATQEPTRLDLRRFACLAVQGSQPLAYLQAIPNMAAAHVAIACQARGLNTTFYASGVAGLQAIGEAALAVVEGRADLILAGGADSAVSPDTLRRAPILGLLRRTPANPGEGIVPGEGAGVLVLETLAGARERGARIYGEILGYATAVDGRAFPEPSSSSDALVDCMESALRHAHITPPEVDYVSSHGEGNPGIDSLEAAAIREVFGTHAAAIRIGALKVLTGHLGVASSAVEAIATLLAMRNGSLPAALDSAPGRAGARTEPAARSRSYRMETVLCNATLRGQLCVSLVMRRLPEPRRPQ